MPEEHVTKHQKHDFHQNGSLKAKLYFEQDYFGFCDVAQTPANSQRAVQMR